MNSQHQENSVNDFLIHSKKYWEEISSGNSKSANGIGKKLEKIVRAWSANGCAEEYLTTMLSHEDDMVKYAAAACLINFDLNPLAINTLRHLAKNNHTLISSSSLVILRGNKVSIEE